MSIYVSLEAPSEFAHDLDCTVWEHFGAGSRALTLLGRSPRPCSCTQAMVPLVYAGSHVLPSDADPRGGYVDLSSIPAHIRREGREPPANDDQPYPYLRVGVNEAKVILTRDQVALVHETLAAWLRDTQGPRPRA